MGKKRKGDSKLGNEDKEAGQTSSDVPRTSTASKAPAPDGIPPPQSSQPQPPQTESVTEKDESKQTEDEGGQEEEKEVDKNAEADRLKELGNVAFKAARYDEAVTRYTDAIALVSSQAAYYGNRAAAYISLKKFRLALEDCQQAKSLQQASPQLKTLLRLARCQLATGSPGPALSTLREAQALAGGEGTTTNRDLWQLKTNAETMQRHLDSVAKARAKLDWSTASAALEAARRGLEGGEGRDVPTEWRCWAVELKMARGDWNGAMEAVKDAQRYEGNSPDIYALRGQVLFLTNKSAESTSILRHAISLDPENGKARRLLKRVKELEKVKEDGNAAFKHNRWEDAVSKYSEALEVVGENPEEGEGGIIRAILLSNRAIALSKIGTDEKYEEALADLDVSLKLHPDGWKAMRTRARIRLAKDDYEQALSDLREALELAESGIGNDGAQNELREEIRKTEVLLKRSKEKDYYKILGISRSATSIDIKKAYKKESMIHHPDKGGDEEKFKLVVEAHAVLSDPVKRERYDSGEDIDGQMNSGGPGAGFPGGVDISEMLFAQMFGGGGGGGGGYGGSPFGGGFPGHHGHSHSHSHSRSRGYGF